MSFILGSPEAVTHHWNSAFAALTFRREARWRRMGAAGSPHDSPTLYKPPRHVTAKYKIRVHRACLGLLGAGGPLD